MTTLTIPAAANITGRPLTLRCASRKGGLAVTREPAATGARRGWKVTHVRSGLIAAGNLTLTQARRVLSALLAIEGADWTKDSDAIHPRGLCALGELVYDVRARALRERTT